MDEKEPRYCPDHTTMEVLRTRMNHVEEDVKDIKDNHLSSIYKTMEEIKDKFNEKFDGLQKWLIGLLGGVVVSLILLIVQLFTQ